MPASLQVYPMTKKRRGFCMIINNEKFDVEKMHTRLGSSVDAENLLNLFSQLGFDVRMKQ